MSTYRNRRLNLQSLSRRVVQGNDEAGCADSAVEGDNQTHLDQSPKTSEVKEVSF